LWVPGDQLLPVSNRLRAYFKSHEYNQLLYETMGQPYNPYHEWWIFSYFFSYAAAHSTNREKVFYVDWDCPEATQEDFKQAVPFRRTAHCFPPKPL